MDRMDLFTPITNAECVLPPKTGGRKSRQAKRQAKRKAKRTYKGGKAKLQSKYHSAKRTRKGRVTRRRK